MGTQDTIHLWMYFSRNPVHRGLWEFLSFAERYPTIIYNILLFGLTSALGQVSALIGDGLASPRETGLAGREERVARSAVMSCYRLSLVDTQEPA